MKGLGPGRATLLLVDDRDDNLQALTAILEPTGHRLLTCKSGEEALKILLNDTVDVVLLDVRMPGMDGYETAAHIKMLDRTRDIPIIFLTAEPSESEQALKAFSAGAVDFVPKPFEPWILRAKVQVFVELSEKTALLKDQTDSLRHELDRQYAVETEHLRKLADAALAINSTQSLHEMLRTINDSAREIIDAHHAETVFLADFGIEWPSHTRSHSPKYDAWAAEGRETDLSSLYGIVLDRGAPVRMGKREIGEILSAHAVGTMVFNHPMLEGWLAAPLVTRGGLGLGLIQVSDKVDGDFSEQDELVLVQLAQLAAVAIDNAQRFEREHEIAHTLQRAMLPPRLVCTSGVDLAARYRAGGAGTEVGGDWYDSVELDDGRLMLMVGDVVGRGAAAAAVMGQLRTGFRAYALQRLPVTELMSSLDRLLQDLGDGRFATAVCVVVDPIEGTVEVVSAGHPPPLLIGPDGGTSFVPCDAHTPLGVLADPLYAPYAYRLRPGSTLLLYTDGLVESRDLPLEDGMRALKVAVAGGPAAESVDDLCDRVLAEIVGDQTGDDVALLAARFSR